METIDIFKTLDQSINELTYVSPFIQVFFLCPVIEYKSVL